ncbi:hypothetical protein [Moorena sp. SIO4G3]|uniref:hypothetical protein n=1 Tax=Moorena sp. SIO4G3 TaxID=2607821 RepID=UPI001429DE6C|nr:hypothetical protein [Moorena sp. SIO4G3]NEO78088.1 hypothetical protein [Moorena sp. SIO4G3]
MGIGSETGHGYRTLVGIAEINLGRIWVSKPAMPTLQNPLVGIAQINLARIWVSKPAMPTLQNPLVG